MQELVLKQKKISLINKQGNEIELEVYYVVVNDIEVNLKPNDYTCKSILENYYKNLNNK